MSRRLGHLIPFCGVAWPLRETIILRFGHRSLMTSVRSKSASTSKFGINRGRLDHPSVRRLQWLPPRDNTRHWELDNKIFISDLRMGVEGAYVFNFEVGLRKLSGIEIGSFQQLERRPRLNQIGQVWRRIFDPTMAITERSQPLTN